MKNLASWYKDGQNMLVRSIVQMYAHMARDVQVIKRNTMYCVFTPEQLIESELYGHWHVHTFEYNRATKSLQIRTVE